MSIIFYISEATCFSGKLLMHNNWKEQLTLLLYKQTWLTFVLKAPIDLYFLDLSRNPLFYFFQDHLGLSCRQTSRISTGSLRTTQNSLVSPWCQKYRPTKQMSKLYFMEILFQNDSYFTGTWTYPVRLPIPSMQLLRPVFQRKADNCNICIKIVIMFFCI